MGDRSGSGVFSIFNFDRTPLQALLSIKAVDHYNYLICYLENCLCVDFVGAAQFRLSHYDEEHVVYFYWNST